MRSSRSGETAQTLILVGLILQGVELATLLLAGFLFLIIVPTFLGGLFVGLALIGVVWLVLVYLFSYARVRDGDYAGARTPTFVFAVLSLVTFALISGVLYLVAYVKLGDAEHEQGPSVAWNVATPAPPSLPPSGSKYCPRCGRPNPPGASFCQACGAPLP
jgi:zinc-ribbon domain